MTKKAGLELMREPFPKNQIGRLPKPTKEQTNSTKKTRCKECGGWHDPHVVHLDYVGHAALTDRLLDVDPAWNWEPVAFNEQGLPAFDPSGGLWIKLTVCGVSRLGYGHAAASSYKEIGSREKEVIGDALRNASMRFGAALELWHKGELHTDPEPEKVPEKAPEAPKKANQKLVPENVYAALQKCQSVEEVDKLLKGFSSKFGPKKLEEKAPNDPSNRTWLEVFTEARKFFEN